MGEAGDNRVVLSVVKGVPSPPSNTLLERQVVRVLVGFRLVK